MTDQTKPSDDAPLADSRPADALQAAGVPIPPSPSTPARLATLVLSVVLAISALPVLWLTLVRSDATLWFSTVFELIVLAAAVSGIFSGLGRFREGWALSLACVAGTVLVCAVFAFVEIRANFGDDAAVAGLLKPYLALRLALAAGLAGVASLTVFSRNPASWKLLLWGFVILTPAVGVLGWLGTRGQGVLSASRATPGAEAVRILALCLGGLVVVVLVSVGLHLLIRAYEMGRTPDQLAADAAGGSEG